MVQLDQLDYQECTEVQVSLGQLGPWDKLVPGDLWGLLEQSEKRDPKELPGKSDIQVIWGTLVTSDQTDLMVRKAQPEPRDHQDLRELLVSKVWKVHPEFQGHLAPQATTVLRVWMVKMVLREGMVNRARQGNQATRGNPGYQDDLANVDFRECKGRGAPKVTQE